MIAARRALLLAPMGSVHRRFNACNVRALRSLGHEVHLLANFGRGEGAEAANRAMDRIDSVVENIKDTLDDEN